MEKKIAIAVLGSGKIGSVISRMLVAQGHEVYSIALSGEMMFPNTGIKICPWDYKDLFQANWVEKHIKGGFLVVNALPGKIGFDALTKAVEAGKNVVDVSFWDYDKSRVDALDLLAKERGVTALIDLGWSPGMTNILIGHAMTRVDAKSIDCIVGGVPQFDGVNARKYKSPYCVEDSFKFAMSPQVGFDSGKSCGIIKSEFERRSLPSFCKHGTYRPWGFAADMDDMKRLGFFKPENLLHTIKILENEWAIDENYRDISYMDIYVRGKDKTIEYHMVDRYDEETKTTSMARLTAITAVVGVNLLSEKLEGIGPGIIPPEALGRSQEFSRFAEAWKDAGFEIEEKLT